MARQIDESKPLSRADRQWLIDWGKFDTIARIDAAHGVELGDDQSEDTYDAAGAHQELLGRLNDVLVKHNIGASSDPVSALDAALSELEQSQPPSSGGDILGNSDQSGPDDKPDDDYEELTNDELRELLGERELSKSGNKEELIARLREDDEG
jgi:hypothetical protein